jgi:malate dehydrogenase (oxaloacetate-decarboxylating)
MGVIAAGATRVTDEMFLTAARVLSDLAPAPSSVDTLLLPPLEDIREVSRRVALAVGVEAQLQGLARRTTLEGWERTLAARQWVPRYRPMRYSA